MTDSPLYFDTDCLSAFLWVKNEGILSQLYPGRVVLSRQSYDELGAVPHLQARIDKQIFSKKIILMDIVSGTPEHELYAQLTRKPLWGHVIIGAGEAAALVLAKYNDGIVASNNLRDVAAYIKEWRLELKTTGDIMLDAFNRGMINEQEGNDIWYRMIKRKRKLGADSFSVFLRSKGY